MVKGGNHDEYCNKEIKESEVYNFLSDIYVNLEGCYK